MRILITGATGLLGSKVVKCFAHTKVNEIYGLARTVEAGKVGNTEYIPLDLTDKGKLSVLLDTLRPEVIIHCAANVNLVDCETNQKAARNLHVHATKFLVQSPDLRKFLYISTDSVFDGKNGNYSETSTPAPLNYYAQTKLEGEQIALSNSEVCTIIRTSIYGVNHPLKSSLAEWAIKNLMNNVQINGFTDVIFNALNTIQLSEALEKIIGSSYTGVLNVASNTYLSKYQFLVDLAIKLGKDTCLIRPTSILDFPSNVPRPLNTTLNVVRLKNELGLEYSFESGLDLIVNELNTIN